jgi:cob(I)alamin adenosyltransferase
MPSVATLESQSLRFDGWATPGANLHGAALDLARTVARRAERRLVSLPASGRSVRPVIAQYTNRIADLLWLLARQAEQP